MKINKYVQCPPIILAPLVNISKGGCENKSALFIATESVGGGGGGGGSL